jgi:hypothetical protein
VLRLGHLPPIFGQDDQAHFRRRPAQEILQRGDALFIGESGVEEDETGQVVLQVSMGGAGMVNGRDRPQLGQGAQDSP